MSNVNTISNFMCSLFFAICIISTIGIINISKRLRTVTYERPAFVLNEEITKHSKKPIVIFDGKYFTLTPIELLTQEQEEETNE
jgi:hypothetical protein